MPLTPPKLRKLKKKSTHKRNNSSPQDWGHPSPCGLFSYARCLTAKQNGGIRSHKREASGVWDGCRIRRLTPRECLRLQGWTDERIDLVLPLQSDAQLYKQAGNGVTVNVVEAIGKRLAAAHREVNAVD